MACAIVMVHATASLKAAARTEPARAASFQAELDPAPFDGSTRADVINGVGDITATLSGDRLEVAGRFSRLASATIAGSLRIGVAKGAPGPSIGVLQVSQGLSGTVHGSVKLTGRQIAALRQGALYVRIDTETASDGALQGWLERGMEP